MTTTAVTTILRIYRDSDPTVPLMETSDGDVISEELRNIGVRFERWAAETTLPAGADQATVIAAYQQSIDRLVEECGYEYIDVVRVERGMPNIEPMRQKFLNEHFHAEDEVRFFVEGKGAFYLRVNNRIHQVICVRGDLMSVPVGTKHWFDMGANPEFTAIRFFTTKEGWVAEFTGDMIAERFPKLEA